jgi:accessory secretory protein Asp3
MSTTWKIYWNDYSFETYIYGSVVKFHKKDDVEFSNTLMSPGKVIKTWYSKVNFQAKKTEPTLPMIDGESKYHIRKDITCDSPESLLLRIVFFDRYETEVESIIVREDEIDFKCPLKTYSYQIELINAGAKSFHFHSLVLTEYSNESEKI